DSLFSFTIDSLTPGAQHNFQLLPEQGCNMSLSISGTRARSGFLQQTDITYYNEMWQPVNGMIAVTLDSLFYFDHATIPPDSLASDGLTYFWKFDHLGPYDEKSFSIYSTIGFLSFWDRRYFQLSTAIYANCSTTANALATDSLVDFIFSSFDPNEKDVFP